MAQHIQWIFKDARMQERGGAWIVGVVIVGITLITYALVTLDFLFAFILFLGGLVLIIGHFRGAKTYNVKISDEGITIGSKNFPFSDIKDFWIYFQPPLKYLYFRPKTWYLPAINIPLADQDPVDLRRFIRQYIHEDMIREQEPITDQIMRKFKI